MCTPRKRLPLPLKTIPDDDSDDDELTEEDERGETNDTKTRVLGEVKKEKEIKRNTTRDFFFFFFFFFFFNFFFFSKASQHREFRLKNTKTDEENFHSRNFRHSRETKKEQLSKK